MKNLFFFLILLTGFAARGQIITTIAGTDSAGFAGDGGPATSALMRDPGHIAIDNKGNLYIADPENQRIRKVNPSGIITTFAGDGVAGYSGDGGAATNAQFKIPIGISVDTAGIVYIVDMTNECIRKVDTTGIVSAFAGVCGAPVGYYAGDGGAATAANLDNPWSVFADKRGNVFIADAGSNRIRKVNAAGIITTVAGNGSLGLDGDNGPATAAQMNSPTDVAADATGNLYILDDIWRIRKVDTSGIITTIAGADSLPGYSGDGGPATTAKIYGAGIAIDKQDNIYIACGNRVRKVNAAGIITTIAGTGTTGYSGNGGPALDAEFYYGDYVTVDNGGNLYISDGGNHCVRYIQSTLETNSVSRVPNAINIYPNPATQYIRVSCPQSFADGYTISNMLGQIALRGSGVLPSCYIDVSNLPAGSYILNVFNNNLSCGNKLFVKE